MAKDIQIAKPVKGEVVLASDYNLDEDRAGEIQSSFQPMVAQREELAKKFEEVIALPVDAKASKKARELRLQLVKIRTGIAGIHKDAKEFFLRGGQFADATKRILTKPVTDMEEKLREIEDHQANIERERIEKVTATRLDELHKYEVPAEQIPVGLGAMKEDVYATYLAGCKAAYDARKEAEHIAEQGRIAKEKAEQEARDKIAADNERLKKEAEDAAAKAKAEEAERAKVEKARVAKETKEREAREKAEKDRLAKEADERAEMEAAAEKERQEAAKKLEEERQAAAKAQAEADAAAAEELAKATAKLDKEKAEREALEKKNADREAKEAKDLAETEARNKDTEHRKAVNNAIVDAMLVIPGAGHTVKEAYQEIVKAMVKGDIPNVAVNY